MYWTLFITFFKIGAFTIGGGFAMLPFIQREVVNRGWMTEEEFIDIFAVAQSLPGVFAVNIAVFIGYRLKRVSGAIVCMLASILPSFLIILAIAMSFTQIKDNEWVEKVFKGFRPATVALIAVPCLTMAIKLKIKGVQILIPATAALLIWLADFSPIYIIIIAAASGIAYDSLKKGGKAE
jgi:Chromate transport protein ChrA